MNYLESCENQELTRNRDEIISKPGLCNPWSNEIRLHLRGLDELFNASM